MGKIEDVLEHWTRQDPRLGFTEPTSVAYFVYTLCYQVVFLVFGVMAYRALAKEFTMLYLDVFKVMQMIFILLHLLTRNFYGFLVFFD